MSQRIISTFEVYYLRRTSAQSRYTTENIYESWQETTAKTMTAVWKHFLSYCANGFRGFKIKLIMLSKKIGITGKDLGFEGVESPSVRECQDLHS
jgi:hypothetical protein